MPTEVSPKVKMIAENELQRLREAEKKLQELEKEKAQYDKIEDVPGGRITVGKRWDASKGEKGEYVTAAYANLTIWKKDAQGRPVESATKKWIDKNGVEHPNYEIYTVVRLPESIALKIFSGEAKAGTLWHTPFRNTR